MNNIKFPIIAFDQNFFRIVKDIETLKQFDAKSFAHQLHKEMTLIDSELKLFEVKDAKKVGYHGLFWGFSLFYSRTVILEYEFKNKVAEISMEQLKQKICDRIDKNIEFWEEAADIDKLKICVNKCNTFSDLINLPFFN